MLSRARLIKDTKVERFDWNAAAGPAIADGADGGFGPGGIGGGAPGGGLIGGKSIGAGGSIGGTIPAPKVVLDAPAPVKKEFVPEPPTPDQQAHLASLEREAFTKGYAQGERAGLEAGGKRAEAMLRRVAQTLEELGNVKHTVLQQSERQMVQLAVTLAKRVVQRELSLDPELIAAMAHVALKKLGDSNPATIRLHPEDYTVVARDGERWSGSQVTVVPDPSIARGGCLVESDFGRIDASLDRQFKEMTRALLGADVEPGPPQHDAS